jgi:predicted AlkP superfamily phosphohydrolase/phosphomutase
MSGDFIRKSDRIVAIGLDSADFFLIERWISEGKLPALARLIKAGSWTDLVSTADMGSGSVWPTLFTGTSPAKHNSIGTRRIRSGSYQITQPFLEVCVEREPFWNQLSRSGKRVALIDVPKTRPVDGLNGIQLVGWGAHSPGWYGDSWPPALYKDVLERFGEFPVPDCDHFIPTTHSELKTFHGNLLAGIGKTESVSHEFLGREPWDFFLTVFSAPHCAGHNFWHLMDKNHPRYDEQEASSIGNTMIEVYSAIDSSIGRLAESGEDVTLLILSTEGMGPNYTGSFLMPEILRRLGLSGHSSAPGSNGDRSKGQRGLIDRMEKMLPARSSGPHAVRNLKSRLPGGAVKLMDAVKRMVPRETWQQWKCKLMMIGNDWKESRAFCLPSDFNGAVRINLKGREPDGKVEPGSEFDALCDELVYELGRLKHSDTGAAAVAEVIRVDRVYDGPFLNDLPDIVVKWKGDRPIRSLTSDRVGTVAGENYHERSGSHRPVGFLLAAGRHIVPGSVPTKGHIMDIAPTILYLSGEPVSRSLDGRVLLEIIDETFKENNPVRFE